MTPVDALVALGGAATASELRKREVSDRDIARAVLRGIVVRPSRGLYCLPGAEKADVTQALGLRGVLSCGAAVRHHELELFGRASLHVTVASQRAGLPRGVVVHRTAADHDDRVTGLLQTIKDCCRCLPVEQAVSVLDSALRQGRVDLDELAALAGPRGRWSARIRRAVGLVDPQAQSVLESAGRVLLVTRGVGSLASQVPVDGVGWVDLVVDGWLVIELDGYEYHQGTFREDRRRDAELAGQGYRVLRFTYDDIARRPEWVLGVVRQVLAQGKPLHDRRP